ncbi:MAG: M15 family metallopeptidase [Clostridia bacterium]|nr:M15 family metallopeptidase [Clostridia bacterium]
MAKNEKTDAYTILKRVLAVLLVFTAIAAIGFFYTRNTVDSQLAEIEAQRQQQNENLIEQHNQWLAEQASQPTDVQDERWPAPNPNGWDVVDISDFAVNAAGTESFTHEEMETAGLMLVNRWHYLPSDFTDERFANGDELVSIGSQSSSDGFPIQVANYNVMVQRSTYSALAEMLRAASADGLENYLIDEGFRTNESQTESFLKEQAKWEDRYTGEVLIEKARENVSVPGTSEYQTGLSFRIRRYKRGDADFNGAAFASTEHLAWLEAHAWEYGFVFRFPVSGYPLASTTDKSWKTGMSLKMMMYRYVGKPAAAVMHTLDYCLEEFIEYMQAHPHIAVYQDGSLKYEIYRIQDNGSDATVDVPRGAQATASIDNMGGVIVCLEY